MATIRPFNAVRPGTGNQPWDHHAPKMQVVPDLDYLRLNLEPDLRSSTPDLAINREFLDNLLKEKTYIQEQQPAIYVYECIREDGSSTGILALTSLEDAKAGKIIAHEHTLRQKEDRIAAYRETIGLEGAAVVLAHEPSNHLETLIPLAKKKAKDFSFTYQGSVHNFWKVATDAHIREFQLAFSAIPQVYLADGHHRMGAAARLHEKTPQWIYSLYMSTEQLSIQAFHRLVITEQGFAFAPALTDIEKYFYFSRIPGNRPFRPNKRGLLGMCVKGTWYQLYRKDETDLDSFCDADLLQQKILAPSFGIIEPRTDPRLFCLNNETAWGSLLDEIAKEPRAIAFTLSPMKVSEMITISNSGKVLPPKTTYITPKAPFGLVMYFDRPLTIKTQEL